MAHKLRGLAEWAGIVASSRYDEDDFAQEDEYPSRRGVESVTEAVTAAVPQAPRRSADPVPRRTGSSQAPVATAAVPPVIVPPSPAPVSAVVAPAAGITSIEQHRSRRPVPVREATLEEIAHIRPQSYSADAKRVAEGYRDGVPQILNMSDMDSAEAFRLIDFAAGLRFALDGSLEKITARVFLLSPPSIKVTDSDKERIAAGGLVAQA